MNEQYHQMETAIRGEADARQKRLPPGQFPIAMVLTLVCCFASDACAFRVLDVTDALDLGIVRWNAAPHFVDGVERSLDGGLRYSIEGGSYAAFRDQFEWAAPAPTVVEFQMAVEQAFANWEAVDPESGLGTDIYFVPDFNTPIDIIEPPPNTLEGRLRLNPGAEIDITSWANLGASGQNETYGDPNSDSVTLTSGVTNYPAAVYSGSDIRMNTLSFGTEPWPLERFKYVLTHEIGHALGLSDVDVRSDGVNSLYYDDNFDNASHETALATLTNSFAHLIDPLDPNNSPGLMLFEPCSGGGSCFSSPGLDSPGVNILQETSAQVEALVPQNDDFAGRQFLYPYVPVNDADFDFDGDVDGDDFLAWQTGFGITSGAAKIDGDYDNDGDVDGDDFLGWQAGFGSGDGSASAAVPEPASMALVIAAVAAGMFSRRRGRRRRSL